MFKKKNSPNTEQIGTLWLNESKKGTKFFKGSVNGADIIGFLNEVTTGDGRNTTVMNVFEAVELESSPNSKTAKTASKRQTTSKVSTSSSSDIPF